MSRSSIARRLVGVLVALGLVASWPAPAAAHAELVEGSPAPNASLVEGPDLVVLTFTESIDPDNAFIDVIDAGQRPLDTGAVEVSPDGREAQVTLPELEPGVYTVTYQVVSTVDGHATTGLYAFLVDPTGAAPPPTDSSASSSPSVDPLTIAARWAGLAAALVAMGSMLLWSLSGRSVLLGRSLPDHPPWTLVAVASGGSALGLVAYLALAARPIAAAAGSSGTGIPFDPAAPFGWTPFAVAMRASIGASLVVAGIAAWGAVAGGRWRWTGGLTALLGVSLGGMSLAAHAASAGGIGFALIDWLHLLGVAAWLGALPAALVLGTRGGTSVPGMTRALLRRHGRVALVAVPVVVLTGIANSPLVLGSGRDLVASDYGNLLIAKATLLSVAVAIGAVNHLALRGRGRAAVLALVGAELVVAVMAVSAAATMVTIQPASARQPVLATAPVNPAHLFATLGPSRVHVAVSLPSPGNQSYRLTVTDAESGLPREDVQKVFLGFRPPANTDLPPQRVELETDARGGGLYATNGAFTPVDGEWELEVVVRRAGERDETVVFELPVSSPGAAELGPPPSSGVDVPAPIALTWTLLPPGQLAWLVPATLLAALLLANRLPAGAGRSALRGAFLTALLVMGIGAGTRGLVTAANTPTEDALRDRDVAAGDARRGERVYLANCSSCHGARGEGDGPVRTLPEAGSLAQVVPNATDAELSYRIAYGVAGTPMPAFAGLLTAEERNDLIAHLRTRFGDE